MFQYLPHRRWLCDEPYRVHPPTAPAALERKHPVDARQQLRPHIAHPLSRPRGAGNFAQRLWPGCLAPRRQLPAGLRRHQRPPRRVRHQYPKEAVLMLARRRYQRRYPIQKFAGAQPQFNTSLLTEPVPLQRRPNRYQGDLRVACPSALLQRDDGVDRFQCVVQTLNRRANGVVVQREGGVRAVVISGLNIAAGIDLQTFGQNSRADRISGIQRVGLKPDLKSRTDQFIELRCANGTCDRAWVGVVQALAGCGESFRLLMPAYRSCAIPAC